MSTLPFKPLPQFYTTFTIYGFEYRALKVVGQGSYSKLLKKYREVFDQEMKDLNKPLYDANEKIQALNAKIEERNKSKAPGENLEAPIPEEIIPKYSHAQFAHWLDQNEGREDMQKIFLQHMIDFAPDKPSLEDLWEFWPMHITKELQDFFMRSGQAKSTEPEPVVTATTDSTASSETSSSGS